MSALYIDRVDSPIGEVLLVSDGESLWAMDFDGYEDRMTGLLARRGAGARFE